jgi:hypothetical protein
MIEILKYFADNVIARSCKGQVTKEDYDGILVPAMLEAPKRPDKIRLLYANFTDYDPSAGSGSRMLTGLCKRCVYSVSLCLARRSCFCLQRPRRRMPGSSPPVERGGAQAAVF